MVEQPLEWDDGYLLAPTAPGLGVELNHEVLAAHPAADGGRLHLEMCQVVLDSDNRKTIDEL